MTTSSPLRDLISRLRAKVHDHEEALVEIKADLASAERTMELLGEDGASDASPALLTTHRREEYEGLSHVQAIAKLARLNDGAVTVIEAKRMLLEAGLTKSKKVYQMATSTIIRSKRFEWIASGTYQLKPDEPGT